MAVARAFRKEWEFLRDAIFDDNLEYPDRVFTKGNGTPIFPDTIPNWYRHFIKRIRKDQRQELLAAGVSDEDLENLLLPEIRFHDLRHTCGTFRSALGERIEDVGAYLGHADASSTRIYVHPMLEEQEEISRRMEMRIMHRSQQIVNKTSENAENCIL